MNRLRMINNNCRVLLACSILSIVMGGILCPTAFSDGTTLTGTVIGQDETPVADIVVTTGQHTTTTDTNGAFHLTGLDAGNMVIRLQGDKGEGRVRVVLGTGGASGIFVYPVVTTVVLLHDNDQHFNFNHREAFEAEVTAIRNRYKNVFLLNAGDIFVRHADRWAEPENVSYYHDLCIHIVTTMNEIGYDACTLGNHELAYIDHYTGNALELTQFPLLGANIVIHTDKMPTLSPYILLETDNALRLAVLGLTRGGGDGIEVLNYRDTAKEYRHLAQENDLFVALTHLGLSQDKQLAEALPELDVIIGGHSHNLLEAGEWVENVLMAMAGGPPSRHQLDPEWPKYLGKITITFENDRVVDKQARVMTFTAADVPAATP